MRTVPSSGGVSSQSALRSARSYRLEVPADDAGTRLDKYLALHLPELSRTQLQRLIQEGQVQASRGEVTASSRVQAGAVITVRVPPPQPAHPVAEDIPLRIVYEDDALLVIDKPPGLVVHPAPGHTHGTLVNALLFHCPTLSGVGGEARPGIVHRLDKDTSGLLLVAKHDRSHRHLAAQLKTRQLQRGYLALVRGPMPALQGTIAAPIGRHPQHRKKMATRPRGAHALPGFTGVGTYQPVTVALRDRSHASDSRPPGAYRACSAGGSGVWRGPMASPRPPGPGARRACLPPPGPACCTGALSASGDRTMAGLYCAAAC
jgi:RluA family pseudouridine synthase